MQPFTLNDYFTEQMRPCRIAYNFHRTTEIYVDTLADNVALIERIEEPRLPGSVAAQHSEHAWACLLLAFIVIKARRIGA